jgi:hypothetical protein
MTLREITWTGLRAAAGLCSAIVTLHGLYGAYGLDFRRDTLVSALYVLLPFLSFFVFLFVKAPKIEACLHALIASGYLTTYSMLNWRSCVSLGDCSTVPFTVLETLRTKPALAAFGVVLFSVLALYLDAAARRQAA